MKDLAAVGLLCETGFVDGERTEVELKCVELLLVEKCACSGADGFCQTCVGFAAGDDFFGPNYIKTLLTMLQ